MNLGGQTVLITGGTGSWGNAAVRYLLSQASPPQQIRIFSRDEVKQAQMLVEFKGEPRLRFLLGDVRDLNRLESAFSGVDIVFHAAALKRVESCAYNPTEAISTNVLGSMNVAQAARSCSVKKVVALSSDKACAPSTTYGATKLCMEQVFCSSTMNAHAKTVFSVVRYGNVAGARGSVIPIWRECLSTGKPLPITSPDATRFWFTLSQAVELAMWAATYCSGGELVVPDLPCFFLSDLAAVIAPNSVFTSMDLRPGEKLHESMISKDEAGDFIRTEGKYIRPLPGSGGIRGIMLPEGFELTSKNSWVLSREELYGLIRQEGL